ncbi:glycosyltransferase family 39 protein [Pseudorhodoferax sp. Leaf267]|uniref:ArnT family glycosyltransferase n=1 Tax=Pseudorhodoferax sp. Leaf267 TaxID=1736316 RepID=UPI000712F950|nr:glycosyltransferase family 39 protein [Pseudorhodoferax sp. Leaf267]KQP18007.1 hypothetical protein ASF43_09115 [Pseudorhodoferax sp. Leaf267]
MLDRSGWSWLLLYFAAHVVCRTLVSPALELDEAEQALWSQQLQSGYGAQPPLYTWLQWATFQLLGASVFSLSLLKNTLLGLTYVLVFLAGRLLMPAGLAAVASACMLLLPQIGWESSRDLTHSVLLTTMAAATLYVVLRLQFRPSPWLYLLLGLVIGLGALSKYSYAAFVVLLLLTVATGRDTRSMLRSPWLLATAAVALLVVAPHALWLLTHWQQATQGTVHKLAGAAGGIGRGLASLPLALAAFVAPWALVMLALFGRALWRPAPGWPRGPGPAPALDIVAFWRRYAVALALAFLGMVLFGGVTHFKDRWMLPFLFCAPLMLFSSRLHLAEHPRLPWLRRVLLVVALLTLVLLTLRVPFHAMRNRPDELNVPARELVRALRVQGYNGGGTILTSDPTLGGILRLAFPAARVELVTGTTASPLGRPVLAIDSTSRCGTMTEAAASDATQHPGALRLLGTRAPIREIALPYAFGDAALAPACYRYGLLP